MIYQHFSIKFLWIYVPFHQRSSDVNAIIVESILYTNCDIKAKIKQEINKIKNYD